MENEYGHIKGFEPIIDENSKILILGTLPSNESIKKYKETGNQDYYKDNSNHFWEVISQLFLDGRNIKTESYEYRKELLLNNYIALWDVLKSADRLKGKSKDDFKNPTPNDIKSILKKYPNISYVYFNGKGKTLNYFNKFNKDIYNEFPQITFDWLYSTSNANNGNFKIEQWENALKKFEKEVESDNKNEVISYFKNLYDEIKNVNLNEEKASEYLQKLYGKAINGFPGFSDSVDTLVNDYLKEYKNREEALKELIRNQVIKCTTSGFITGCPGLLAIPIALPANICSVLYIQLRMIAAIAKIRGYDIYSDQVQTFVFSCLVKGGIVDVVATLPDEPQVGWESELVALDIHEAVAIEQAVNLHKPPEVGGGHDGVRFLLQQVVDATAQSAHVDGEVAALEVLLPVLNGHHAHCVGTKIGGTVDGTHRTRYLRASGIDDARLPRAALHLLIARVARVGSHGNTWRTRFALPDWYRSCRCK